MQKKEGAGMPAGQNIPPKSGDVVKDKPVKCTVAGVPLEEEKKPPPPNRPADRHEGEGDKTKCPACGHEF